MERGAEEWREGLEKGGVDREEGKSAAEHCGRPWGNAEGWPAQSCPGSVCGTLLTARVQLRSPAR